jgi:pimeloyl-ACP methyl ester carboxylesterase
MMIFFYDDTLLIARTIKNATLQIIKDAGHMITMESPDEVTRVILDWI